MRRPGLPLLALGVAIPIVCVAAAIGVGCDRGGAGGARRGTTAVNVAGLADEEAAGASVAATHEVFEQLGPGRIGSLPEEGARELAFSSAPGVFMTTVTNFMATAGGPDAVPASDSSCPERSVEGATRVLRGGCTDELGRVWTGSALATGFEGPGDATLTYDHFGFEGTVHCGDEISRWTELSHGRFEATLAESGVSDFQVDYWFTKVGERDGCHERRFTYAVQYAGTYAVDATTRAQTWSGSGRVGSSRFGTVEVSTVEEVIDRPRCGSEPLSGVTTARSGDDTVVFTYDGATDCNATSGTVPWTVNGEAQTPLTGVSCAVAASGGGWPTLLVLLALVVHRRRRASRTPRARPR